MIPKGQDGFKRNISEEVCRYVIERWKSYRQAEIFVDKTALR